MSKTGMDKSKFIVIEGSDGSGKATQLALLVDYLTSHHIPHATVDFPQYYKTFFGRWIGRFLKGEFGQIEDVPPYILTIPFAADRWQAKDDINRWLSEGKIVIANRYAASNAAYQAAKLPKRERQRFIDWSFEMEYKVFGIPKEDLVIFLSVPVAVSQKLLAKKDSRKYLGNQKKKDIHESNIGLLTEVETMYMDFCKRFPHWVKIDCVRNGEILSKEDIHQKILSILKEKHIL